MLLAPLNRSMQTFVDSLPSVSEAVCHHPKTEEAAQCVVLSLLYSLPALFALRAFTSVTDNDIWWHLAAGKWILLHRMVPNTDPFSAYGLGRPWAAYSWGFEVPAAWLAAHFGLVGVAFLQCVLITAVLASLHKLISSLLPDFTLSVLLTLAAVFAMDSLFTPRPWLLTILFFTLELRVVLQVRENRRYRQLLWLPLIFCAWANVHAQFVYGLFLLMLATVEAWWNWWRDRQNTSYGKARNTWMLTLFACIAATLINPYFIGIYKIAYQLGTQPHVLNLISELGPLLFRSFSDYLLLVIGLGALASLAWRRESLPFPWILLLWAMLCSFRSRRDLWLMAVVGAATIASNLGIDETPAIRPSKLQPLFVTLGIIVVLVFGSGVLGVNSGKLEREAAETFPASAVEFVKQRQLPGPLYNHYDWGGYLVWALPELPVSMDGRSLLHGTPRLERSADTWKAKHDWSSDPELQSARLIIGAIDLPLCSVLRVDPRYELVYEDKVAVVFVKR